MNSRLDWLVLSDYYSIYVTNAPPRQLNGTLTGAVFVCLGEKGGKNLVIYNGFGAAKHIFDSRNYSRCRGFRHKAKLPVRKNERAGS